METFPSGVRFRAPEGGEFRLRPPDGEEPEVIIKRFPDGGRRELMLRDLDEGQLKQRLEEMMPKIRQLRDKRGISITT